MKHWLLLLCCLSSLCQADGAVWRVSKAGSQLYLGGTLHLLSKTDYPLPDGFDQAYQNAAKVVLETDIRLMQEPAFMQQIMALMTLPAGQSLADKLSPATFTKLHDYLQAHGMQAKPLMGYKAAMLALILTKLEMQKLGLDQLGVDSHYLLKASEDGKALGFLETPEQQMGYLADMGAGQEDELVLYTLEDMQSLPDMLTKLRHAWREADIKALEKEGIQPMLESHPALYTSLLKTRNDNWLPQLVKMLQDKEVELVLVGALHLVGPDGLLAQLAAQGYQLEKL
ncbi:TraB/GumN family protein [Bowmanella denitrificans]|uniref:TraB/GumN family protein n=1 Tax=Bowmanella denitrificans TaxID=366582 RepID=A0ABN0WYP6_9ALTE